MIHHLMDHKNINLYLFLLLKSKDINKPDINNLRLVKNETKFGMYIYYPSILFLTHLLIKNYY
jgi:hypothetical protein